MYYQKGQLMFKGRAPLFCLTWRLRIGNNHFSQWRKFSGWHDKFEIAAFDQILGRLGVALPVAWMVR